MTITIYSKDNCPNCAKAALALQMASKPYTCLTLGTDYTEEDLSGLTHQRQMPIIAIDGEIIGGYWELKKWLEKN